MEQEMPYEEIALLTTFARRGLSQPPPSTIANAVLAGLPPS